MDVVNLSSANCLEDRRLGVLRFVRLLLGNLQDFHIAPAMCNLQHAMNDDAQKELAQVLRLSGLVALLAHLYLSQFATTCERYKR